MYIQIEMETTNTLDELRESIAEALREGTVEQQYPKWLYDCRTKYGISSYTLLVLIDFYWKQQNEIDIYVPKGNSEHFITYQSFKEETFDPKEEVVVNNKMPSVKDLYKTKWGMIIFIFLILLFLYSIVITYKICSDPMVSYRVFNYLF